MAAGATLALPPVHQRVHWSERIAHAGLVVVALLLLAFLAERQLELGALLPLRLLPERMRLFGS